MNGRTNGRTAHAVGREGDGGGEVREDAEKKRIGIESFERAR